MTVLLFPIIDSVKSALSTQVLEGTVTEWPLRSLTGIHLSDIDETDSSSDEVCPKSNLLSCLAVHFHLLEHATQMRTSCFDTNFVSQMKLTTFPLVCCFEGWGTHY